MSNLRLITSKTVYSNEYFLPGYLWEGLIIIKHWEQTVNISLTDFNLFLYNPLSINVNPLNVQYSSKLFTEKDVSMDDRPSFLCVGYTRISFTSLEHTIFFGLCKPEKEVQIRLKMTPNVEIAQQLRA